MSAFLCTIFLTASSFKDTAPLAGRPVMSTPACMHALLNATFLRSSWHKRKHTLLIRIMHALCAQSSHVALKTTSRSQLYKDADFSSFKEPTSLVYRWRNDAIWPSGHLLLRPRAGPPVLSHGNQFDTPQGSLKLPCSTPTIYACDGDDTLVLFRSRRMSLPF